jgi:hypothetical protein
VCLLQRHEQRVIVEPATIHPVVVLERFPQRRCRALAEALPRALEQRVLPLDHGSEVDVIDGERGAGEVVVCQQAVLVQLLQRDQ